MAQREIGSFTPEQTQIIWDIVKEMMAADALRNKRKPAEVYEPGVHRVPIRNDSGEEIPPFGCCQVTGTVEDLGRTFVKVTKPDTICGEYVFNSQFSVAAGEWGWAYAFGLVRMKGTASAYSSCKRYKPTVASWDVSEGPGPFLVYGEDTSIAGSVRGRIVGDHCKAKWIKFTYTVGGGSNATPTVTDYWDGPDPSTCGTVNVEYPLGEPCTDSNVIAFYDPNSDTYQAIATPNAIQGLPVTKDVLITGLTSSSTCGIGWTEQSMKVITCDVAPTTDSVTLQNTALGVVTSVVDSGTSIDITYRDVYVCGYTAESTASIATTECAPPCTGNCVWRWHYGSQGTGYWEPFVTCGNGCDCGSPPPKPANGDDPASDLDTSPGIPCNSTSYTYDESSKFALITGLGI